MPRRRSPARSVALLSAAAALRRHFAGTDPARLIAANREYPVPARVDLQRAIDELMPEFRGAKLSGIHAEHAHETLTLGHLLGNHHSRVVIGPLQFEEVDVGEGLPFRCMRRAMWLAKDGKMPFALILGPATRYGAVSGSNVEVAVPPGEKGAELVRRVLDGIEARVRSAASYRGRVQGRRQPRATPAGPGSLNVKLLGGIGMAQAEPACE